jgi:hypothetical protein
MTRLQKLLHASPGRKSRFHTERGELMPADAWMRLPLTILERFVAADKQRPWIVPSAIAALERIVKKGWLVLEVGAGASTVWWEKRVASLVSLETDDVWAEQLRKKIRSELRVVQSGELAGEMTSMVSESFDIAVIDNSGDRMSPLRVATNLVKPGGWILLDNSDRYPLADEILAGWAVSRFIGLPPKPLTAQETSLYQKPIQAASSR